MAMNNKLLAVLGALLLLAGTALAASISLTVSSLSSITQGETATLTASVHAVGGEVSSVSLSLGALPTGLSTSDSLVQSAGTLSSGQSTSKSWTITGDSSGTYTLSVTATGTSVSSASSTASLVVNEPAFIDVQSFSCSETSVNLNQNFTITFSMKNTGGQSATATADAQYSTSFFTLVSGTDPWSNDLNAGSTGAVSWNFKGSGVGSSKTISIATTSTANN